MIFWFGRWLLAIHTAIHTKLQKKSRIFDKNRNLRQAISPQHCEHSKHHYWPDCDNCSSLTVAEHNLKLRKPQREKKDQWLEIYYYDQEFNLWCV